MGKRYVRVSGVYIIENIVTKQRYIGQSINTHRRMKMHLDSLRRRDHANKRLQHDFIKYGEVNFEFALLEEHAPQFLHSMETYWINLLDAHCDDFGYNEMLTSHNKSGIKFKKRTKEKMSKARMGMIIAESHRKNMSLAQLRRGKGQYRSPEAKRNIARANIERATSIIQYDLDMNFVAEWQCMSEISKRLSYKKSGIQNNISGISKTSNGYIWKYKTQNQ